MGPDGGFEYAPTIYSVVLVLFVLAPLMYLSSKLVVYLLGRLFALLKFLFRKVYLDLNEPGENRRKPT
jgi:hypothetical protein